MNHFRRRLLLLAGALLLGAGCAPARAATELVIAVALSPLSLPVHVAEAQGYFAAEGVAVRTESCASGTRCLKSLLDRSVQLATASEMPVVFASFDRDDFAIVAAFASSSQNLRVIGRRSAGITDAIKLPGRRIGVVAGTSAEYYLDAYLLLHGLDPQSVHILPMAAAELGPALTRGEIAGFAGYSQQTWPALKALGADGITLDTPPIYTESFHLIVDQRTLGQRSGDVIKVLRALARAERLIADDPVRAKAILLAKNPLGADFVEAVFDRFSFRLYLNASLASQMEGEARWALREGHVEPGRRIPNYLRYVDFEPLRAAMPAAASR